VNPSLIVSPVEFSDSGKAVLLGALGIARRYGAELHAVFVRPGRVPAASTAATDPVRRRLADFVGSLAPDGVTIHPVLLSGDPVEAVSEYARSKMAGLVVIGQNGRRGSWYWTRGRYGTTVARAVGCPTISIPNDASRRVADDPSFKNIVCAVDMSPASVTIVTQALALAEEHRGRVTLVHVLERFPYEIIYSEAHASELIEEYRAQVATVTQELRALVPTDAPNSAEVDTEVMSGTPHDAILTIASARKADLIVLGVTPGNRHGRIVMASTTSGVLRGARCPVLTVPISPVLPSEVLEFTGHHENDVVAATGWSSAPVHESEGRAQQAGEFS
jgi:nucleotide-binding universal stress UspA family protein